MTIMLTQLANGKTYECTIKVTAKYLLSQKMSAEVHLTPKLDKVSFLQMIFEKQ